MGGKVKTRSVENQLSSSTRRVTNKNYAESKTRGVKPAPLVSGSVDVNDDHAEEKIEKKRKWPGPLCIGHADYEGLPRTLAARAMVSRDIGTLNPFQSEYSVHLMKR